jgi:hypothetical protein
LACPQRPHRCGVLRSPGGNDAIADTYSHGLAHSNTHGNGHSYSDIYAYADSNSNHDGDSDAHSYIYTKTYADSEEYTTG